MSSPFHSSLSRGKQISINFHKWDAKTKPATERNLNDGPASQRSRSSKSSSRSRSVKRRSTNAHWSHTDEQKKKIEELQAKQHGPQESLACHMDDLTMTRITRIPMKRAEPGSEYEDFVVANPELLANPLYYSEERLWQKIVAEMRQKKREQQQREDANEWMQTGDGRRMELGSTESGEQNDSHSAVDSTLRPVAKCQLRKCQLHQYGQPICIIDDD